MSFYRNPMSGSVPTISTRVNTRPIMYPPSVSPTPINVSQPNGITKTQQGTNPNVTQPLQPNPPPQPVQVQNPVAQTWGGMPPSSPITPPGGNLSGSLPGMMTTPVASDNQPGIGRIGPMTIGPLPDRPGGAGYTPPSGPVPPTPVPGIVNKPQAGAGSTPLPASDPNSPLYPQYQQWMKTMGYDQSIVAPHQGGQVNTMPINPGLTTPVPGIKV